MSATLKTFQTSLVTIAALLSTTAGVAQDATPSAEGTATAEPAATETSAAQPTTTEPAGSETAPQEIRPTQAEPAPASVNPYPEPEPARPKEMAPNGVYAELLGPAGFYSINYERVIGSMVAPRIGFGYLGGSNSGGSWNFVAIPMTVSFVGLHSGAHGFEVGAGGTVFFASGSASVGGTSASGTAGLVTALAGYRLHPVGGLGFQFRVGFEVNAVFGGGAMVVYPWPYLSVGAAF